MHDDRRLIHAEPALPELATVLQGDRIRDRLRAAGHAVEAVRVGYVRYKPGTSAAAGVFVTERGGATRAAQAVSYPAGERDKLDKLLRRGELCLLADVEHGFALVLDEGDRRLPGLGDARRSAADMEPVVYKPGRRWVGISRSEGTVVKVHTLHGAAAAVRAHRLVAPHVPTADLVSVDVARGIVVTRLLDGVPLDELSSDAAERRSASLEAGRVLAEMHRAPFDPDDVPDGTLVALHRRRRRDIAAAADAVANIAPDLADRAARVAASAAATRTTGDELALVHGDFSADQVIVARGGVRLIDLDRAHVGDRLDDLACWGADAFARGDHAALGDIVEGYRAAGGSVVDEMLRERLAGALLQRAIEPFRRRVPSWHAHAELILARAERLLSDEEAEEREHDDALPGLDVALSEPGVRLVVHRTGRRAVVRVPGAHGDAYVKAVRPKRFAAVEARARRVVGMREARTPRILASDARLGLIRLEGVGERTLLDVGSGPAPDATLVAAAWAQAARVVAELHAMDPTAIDDHGIADELRATRKAVEAAAGAVEDAEPRLRALDDELRALGERPKVLVHRDLHDKQILLGSAATAADPQLGLIDVDTLAAGDPALDIANLLVHLELREVQGLVTAATAATARTAFVDVLRQDPRVADAAWGAIPAYARAARLRLAGVYAVRDGERRAAEAMWRASAASEANTMVW